MFTGLIEEIGTITKILPIIDGKKIFMITKKIHKDLKVDDSVSINGVCLTAIKVENSGFWVEAVGETLIKSTISSIRVNDNVNLERALRLSDRLGGHLVLGHINGIGKIKDIIQRGRNFLLEINLPDELIKYVVSEGSIAVDGISFTIAQMKQNLIGISVIPHTWENTNLQQKKIGFDVNIEVDIIAKYLEKLTINKKNSPAVAGLKLTENWLKENGF